MILKVEQHIYTSRLKFETVAISSGITAEIRAALEANASQYPASKHDVKPFIFRGIPLPCGHYAIMLMGYVGSDYTRSEGNYLAHSFVVAPEDMALVQWNTAFVAAHLPWDRYRTERTSGIISLEPLKVQIHLANRYRFLRLALSDLGEKRLAETTCNVMHHLLQSNAAEPPRICLGTPPTHLKAFVKDAFGDISTPSADVLNVWRLAGIMSLIPSLFLKNRGFSVNDTKPGQCDRAFSALSKEKSSEARQGVKCGGRESILYQIHLAAAEKWQKLEAFKQWTETFLVSNSEMAFKWSSEYYLHAVEPLASGKQALYHQEIQYLIASLCKNSDLINLYLLVETNIKYIQNCCSKKEEESLLIILSYLENPSHEVLALVVEHIRNLLVPRMQADILGQILFFEHLSSHFQFQYFLQEKDKTIPQFADALCMSGETGTRRLGSPAEGILRLFKIREQPIISKFRDSLLWELGERAWKDRSRKPFPEFIMSLLDQLDGPGLHEGVVEGALSRMVQHVEKDDRGILKDLILYLPTGVAKRRRYCPFLRALNGNQLTLLQNAAIELLEIYLSGNPTGLLPPYHYENWVSAKTEGYRANPQSAYEVFHQNLKTVLEDMATEKALLVGIDYLSVHPLEDCGGIFETLCRRLANLKGLEFSVKIGETESSLTTILSGLASLAIRRGSHSSKKLKEVLDESFPDLRKQKKLSKGLRQLFHNKPGLVYGFLNRIRY